MLSEPFKRLLDTFKRKTFVLQAISVSGSPLMSLAVLHFLMERFKRFEEGCP